VVDEIVTFSDVENILVIKLRHIGDVLLTVPVFRSLKENFPQARVSALVNKGTEGVLKNHPLIDEILVFDRDLKKLPPVKKILGTRDFVGDIRRRRFDMTVDLTGGDRPALISRLSGARYRIGWESKKGFWGKRRLYTHLAKPDHRRHTVLQNLEILQACGIATARPVVDFFPTPADEAWARETLQNPSISEKAPLVHVHPTARWLFKCWDDRKMAVVFDWLLNQGVSVVMTSSPSRDEMARAQQIIDQMASVEAHAGTFLNLCGRTTLGQLGALSARSDLFFGVDTAPMHLAAAVGTPVVALFGPTAVFNWGPWDNNACLDLQGEGAFPKRNGNQRMGKNIVLQRDWECVPCQRDGCEGSKVSRCIMDISSEEVIAVLREKLEL
jgi:heptosyltransferase-3